MNNAELSRPAHPEDDSKTECFICGDDRKLERHHIIPDRYEGSDHRRNLVTLCRHCHLAIEAIYSDDIWRRIGLHCTIDPDKPPSIRDRLWHSRTLEAKLEQWKDSRRRYLEERVDDDYLEVPDPYAADTKEVAYQLGRYAAYDDLLEDIKSGADVIVKNGTAP